MSLSTSLAAELAALLPGAQNVHVDGNAVRAVVRSGDAWFATRLRGDPFGELFVTTRPLDGFELAIRWGDRWFDPDLGDPEFDAAFGLTTNDEALLRLWLDAPARAALQNSTYEYQASDITYLQAMGLAPEHPMYRTPKPVRRTWTYELANDELVATKGSAEPSAAKLALAATTACAIAARSQRWAAEYAAIAHGLGGHARSDVELGGAPILTATRNSVEVAVHLQRRVAGAKADRLRTRVTAPRVATNRDTLALVAGDLAKAARVPLPDGTKRAHDLDGYSLRTSGDAIAGRLDALARKLVGLARPATVAIDVDAVDLWFDGAPMQPERLDAALELVARWSVDGVTAEGPYR